MSRSRSVLAATAAVVLLVAAVAAEASRLPVRSYSAADGLAGGLVANIVVDPRGFLWICGSEGLSRFDGQSFRAYGREDGVPSPVVNDILVSRDGTFWVATGAGLSRLGTDRVGLSPGGAGPAVVPVRGPWPAAIRLLEDRSGAIWCGGPDGISLVERTETGFTLRPVELGLPHERSDDAVVSALAEGTDGSLWIGTGSGVTRRRTDGRVEHPGPAPGPGHGVRDLAVAADGSIWVATPLGIDHIAPSAPGGEYRYAGHYDADDGLGSRDVHSLLVSRDGRLWAGTSVGLSVFGSGRFTSWGVPEGITPPVTSLAEDGNGEIWTGGEGLQRVARAGITTWGTPDGLLEVGIASILADRNGRLRVMQARPNEAWIGQAQGDRFLSRPVGLEAKGSFPSWGWNQICLQDREGEWWIATGRGLWRFSQDPARAGPSPPPPKRVYTTADGLANDGVFVLFEDSRGDIWISITSQVTNGLSRWRRSTDRIESFHDGEGLPPLRTSLPTAFAEDRSGNVWIAFNGRGIARFMNGRFDLFSRADGIPEGWVRALLVDRDGRLWVGAGVGGLAVAEDPAAERPSFRPPEIPGGLASNAVRCLVEDTAGRVYAGTSRGVDRIDLARRRIHHFTLNDGLAPGPLRCAFRDREGTLWFGTSHGLSRLVPNEGAPHRPPPVFVTGITVNGVPRELPITGARQVQIPDLPPGGSQVQVTFVSPGAWEADTVRYQYRLEGGHGGWSREGNERKVDFASLASGGYRFVVRAIAADGSSSAEPAAVEFTVLAPFWRRGWFLALAASLAALVTWTAFRYRLGHLLAIERVRTRIAADLHDDIGSSLSRIAILSEVVKRQTAGEGTDTQRFLTDIAETSRQLVDSMGDIVWSIDPRRDNLQHLLGRVGQFAASVLEARGIQWTLDVPRDPDRLRLAPEQRRGIFLVLKEAIANAVRHSGCRTLAVRVTASGDFLSAEVQDDGSGIPAARLTSAASETSSVRRGRGLLNMAARAKEIGGRITFSSPPGGGTLVRLDVPVRSPESMNMLYLGRSRRRRMKDGSAEDR